MQRVSIRVFLFFVLLLVCSARAHADYANGAFTFNLSGHDYILQGVISPNVLNVPNDVKLSSYKEFTKLVKKLNPDESDLIKSGNYDRYNREITIVDSGKYTMQEKLLREGLALVYSWDSSNDDCSISNKFREAEAYAKSKKLGVWKYSDRFYGRYDRANKFIGYFAVVTGSPIDKFKHQGSVLLNYDNNWREDFTVSSEKEVAVNDISNIKSVRGYVRKYNGPYMDLETLCQIEY